MMRFKSENLTYQDLYPSNTNIRHKLQNPDQEQTLYRRLRSKPQACYASARCAKAAG